MDSHFVLYELPTNENSEPKGYLEITNSEFDDRARLSVWQPEKQTILIDIRISELKRMITALEAARKYVWILQREDPEDGMLADLLIADSEAEVIRAQRALEAIGIKDSVWGRFDKSSSAAQEAIAAMQQDENKGAE